MLLKNMPDNKAFVGRYQIYKIMVSKYADYTEGNNYYAMERYLAEKLNCNCTDCGGPDFSRKCNVENFFYNTYWNFKNISMV